jgi:hypothetical protein
MMHAHPHKAGNNVATPRDLTNSLNALKMKRMHLHYLKIDLNPLLAMEASTYEHPPCKHAGAQGGESAFLLLFRFLLSFESC